MKVFFASDHAGFDLKNSLLEYAAGELGVEAVDCGAYEFNQDDDYPEFVKTAVGNLLNALPEDRAVILGKSGQGEAMCANRFSGIRAVVYYGGQEEILPLSREHNDANVLSLGADFISEDDAKAALRLWLETEFSSDERHLRRIEQLDN